MMAQDGAQANNLPPVSSIPSTVPRNFLSGQYLLLGFPFELGCSKPQIRRGYNDLESLELIERIQASEALIQLSQDTRPIDSTRPYPPISRPSRYNRMLKCAMNHPDWPASHYCTGAEPRGRVGPPDIPRSSVRSLLNYTAITSSQERVLPMPRPQPHASTPVQAQALVDLTSPDHAEEAQRRKRSRGQYESRSGPSTRPRSRSLNGSPPSGSEIKKLKGEPSQSADTSATAPALFIEDETSGVQDVLQRQRMELVEGQRKADHERTFKKNQCSICLDRPTDHTSTPCGKNFQIQRVASPLATC